MYSVNALYYTKFCSIKCLNRVFLTIGNIRIKCPRKYFIVNINILHITNRYIMHKSYVKVTKLLLMCIRTLNIVESFEFVDVHDRG